MEFTTKRLTVPALEEVLYSEFKVLDHGFVRVVDYMGGDDSIVQAARVSYGKGTKKVSDDKNLINYLMRNHHTTPFEMCEIKLHVKLPIFVARQWIRHRTANVNEYSARYSILDNEFYLPRAEDIVVQSDLNKQSRGAGEDFSQHQIQRILDILKGDSLRSYEHYLEMINMTPGDSDDASMADDVAGVSNDVNAKGASVDKKNGLARELARINLTLNYYTQWYWKIDLHNLFHFLRLRSSAHAQLEIREYAIAMMQIVSKWVPNTYEAFLNYSLNSVNFSAQAMVVLKKMLRGEVVTYETAGLSRREWSDFCAALKE